MTTHMPHRLHWIRRSGLGLVLWLATATMALAQTAATGPIGQATAAVSAPRVDEVVVQPGDVLRIHIWPDNALGGDFPVEETGLVHLPILGEVQAGEVPVTELRNRLRAGYGSAMKNPVVTITPLFRVSVLGAVQRPGLYTIDPSHSLFDVISLAGGFSPDADEASVAIVRSTGVIEVDARPTEQEGATMFPVAPRSGDRIVVPAKRRRMNVVGIATTVLNSAVLIATLIVRLNR